MQGTSNIVNFKRNYQDTELSQQYREWHEQLFVMLQKLVELQYEVGNFSMQISAKGTDREFIQFRAI
jgi:hypothetical protein